MAKVVVTGCDGYIGSVVAAMLLERKHNVIGVDDGRVGGHRAWGLKVFENDLFEFIRWSEMRHVDVVVHLAASPDIVWCEEHPVEAIQNNTMLVDRLARHCAERSQKLIFASTSAVYGTPKYQPMDERHPVTPTSQYAATKMAAEQAIKQAGCEYTIFRFFNAVGGAYGMCERPDSEHLIPSMIRRTRDAEPVEIYGDGLQVRDYVHVKDIAYGICSAIHEHGVNEVYNLGTGIGYRVEEVVDMFGKFCSDQARIIATVLRPPRLGDVPMLVCDASKAERDLGWTPERDLIKAIREQWEMTDDLPKSSVLGG